MEELGSDTDHILDGIGDRKPLPGPEADQALHSVVGLLRKGRQSKADCQPD